jgi:quercetin dioxygenase-like cupin family protein
MMKKLLCIAVFPFVAIGAGITQDKAGHVGDEHIMIKPDKLKWGPAPPGLPKGAQLAVLAGDPGKKGEPFVIRAKLPDGYKVPPHWHPGAENVTVLKGALMIGRGEKFDTSKMEELTPGSFMSMPMKMRHYAMAKGETIIQVHGIGPFDIEYVNIADDPRVKNK